MKSQTMSTPRRLYRVVANIGAGITAIWLLAHLMPGGRALMLDQILAFVLGLVAAGLLWWAACQGVQPRGLWGWLAAAWTVDLLGDLIWGAYELLSGESLPYISWVDAIYMARYVLILVAFWRGLGVPVGRQWIRLLVLLPLVAVVATVGFCLSVPAPRQTAPWLAGAVYPVLDAGLLYVAWEAWRQETAGGLRNVLGLLCLALLAYGLADCLNFYGQAIPYDAATSLAAFFWPLSDVLAGTGVLHRLWAGSAAASARRGQQRED